MTTAQDASGAPPGPNTRSTGTAKYLLDERASVGLRILVAAFVGVPMLALLAAVPVFWRVGFLDYQIVVVGIIFYYFSGLGVTVGFHRLFTHESFQAKPWFRVLLAIAGSMSVEGSVIQWVGDHRRHHQYSDKEGDPHSPWRFGKDWKALTKGLVYAHTGWLFSRDLTNIEMYYPTAKHDRALTRVSRLFFLWVALSLLLPPAIVGLWTMSWYWAFAAFFWASLVRISFLHHVTWSINSICHTFGQKSFEARDESRNVAWLSVVSFGESWHNLHHAEPKSARHGGLRGQIDTSARVIWIAQKLGWVSAVKWPNEKRLRAKLLPRTRGRVWSVKTRS